MASVLASVPSVVAVTMSQSPALAAHTYASAAAKEKSPSPRSSTRRLPSPSGGAFGSFEALGSFAFCFASSSAFSLFFVFLLMNLCLLPPDFLSRMLFAPGIVCGGSLVGVGRDGREVAADDVELYPDKRKDRSYLYPAAVGAEVEVESEAEVGRGGGGDGGGGGGRRRRR